MKKKIKRKKISTMKIAGIVLVGIGIIIVVTYLFISSNTSDKSLINKSKNEREIDLRQCYNDLCTDKLIIDQNEDSGNIEFDLKNTGNEKITEGVLEIVFDDDERRSFYYPNLDPNDSVSVKIAYDEEELKDVNSYILRERVKE